MNNTNSYKTYQSNAVLTASPQELTLMLYNGAVKFCNIAIKAIEEKHVEVAHINIVKVENIMEEFRVTLDKKYPISESLMTIYDYISSRLMEANLNKDKDVLEEILGYLRELRDTWKEAMKLAKNPKSKSELLDGKVILKSLK